jgi:hypothetical protein
MSNLCGCGSTQADPIAAHSRLPNVKLLANCGEHLDLLLAALGPPVCAVIDALRQLSKGVSIYRLVSVALSSTTMSACCVA